MNKRSLQVIDLLSWYDSLQWNQCRSSCKDKQYCPAGSFKEDLVMCFNETVKISLISLGKNLIHLNCHSPVTLGFKCRKMVWIVSKNSLVIFQKTERTNFGMAEKPQRGIKSLDVFSVLSIRYRTKKHAVCLILTSIDQCFIKDLKLLSTFRNSSESATGIHASV